MPINDHVPEDRNAKLSLCAGMDATAEAVSVTFPTFVACMTGLGGDVTYS